MKVVWTDSARRNLGEIVAYIALDNPGAALRIDDLVVQAAARLGDFPALGKPGAISGTRELLPHPSYRMVYAISPDAVTILALVHTARQWPPLEDENS